MKDTRGPVRVEPEIKSRIVKIYGVLRSTRRTAEALHIGATTVRRALREAGVRVSPHHGETHLPKGQAQAKNFGRIAQWLREHGNRKLPREYSALSLASGASVNAIKCYLYRERRKVRERLRTLPDIRSKRLVLESVMGEKTPGSDIKTYEYRVDRFSLDISITATLRDGRVAIFHVPSLREFTKRVREALR